MRGVRKGGEGIEGVGVGGMKWEGGVGSCRIRCSVKSFYTKTACTEQHRGKPVWGERERERERE